MQCFAHYQVYGLCGINVANKIPGIASTKGVVNVSRSNFIPLADLFLLIYRYMVSDRVLDRVGVVEKMKGDVLVLIRLMRL